jgi:RNA polymerase sigma factor (sigma-70 family)
LLQEVFVRVLQRASSFRGDSSVRTWLYGISRFVIQERIRRVQREGSGGSIDRAASRPGPESLVLRSERSASLIAALQLLPDDQAIVLELHHVEGLSHGEIAVRLGISPAASRKRLERASRALATRMHETVRPGPHARLESWRNSLLRRAGRAERRRAP